jgi:hypothetical protein
MPEGLVRAVWLVLSALRVLRTSVHAHAAVAVTDQARAAVAELPADLTSESLTLVVKAIEDCHRGGEVSSSILENRLTVALTMLRHGFTP